MLGGLNLEPAKLNPPAGTVGTPGKVAEAVELGSVPIFTGLLAKLKPPAGGAGIEKAGDACASLVLLWPEIELVDGGADGAGCFVVEGLVSDADEEEGPRAPPATSSEAKFFPDFGLAALRLDSIALRWPSYRSATLRSTAPRSAKGSEESSNACISIVRKLTLSPRKER